MNLFWVKENFKIIIEHQSQPRTKFLILLLIISLLLVMIQNEIKYTKMEKENKNNNNNNRELEVKYRELETRQLNTIKKYEDALDEYLFVFNSSVKDLDNHRDRFKNLVVSIIETDLSNVSNRTSSASGYFQLIKSTYISCIEYFFYNKKYFKDREPRVSETIQKSGTIEVFRQKNIIEIPFREQYALKKIFDYSIGLQRFKAQYSPILSLLDQVVTQWIAHRAPSSIKTIEKNIENITSNQDFDLWNKAKDGLLYAPEFDFDKTGVVTYQEVVRWVKNRIKGFNINIMNFIEEKDQSEKQETGLRTIQKNQVKSMMRDLENEEFKRNSRDKEGQILQQDETNTDTQVSNQDTKYKQDENLGYKFKYKFLE